MMKVISKFVIFSTLLLSLNFSTMPAANAGCQDYPESITPECVAENLAIAKLKKEADEAAQIAKRLQEEQTARDNAAKDAADRAATIAADNALAPDDCARSTNRYLQRCVDIEVERARLANEAKDAADLAATIAADNALAPDDCARSTNRYLQLCTDASVEKARRENEAIDSIRKISEFNTLQKLASEKYTANKCEQAANQILQVCIDSKSGADAVKKEAASLAKKINETQSLLTKPLVDANGEVILTALLKSKSLSSKNINATLNTRSLSATDKKSLSVYAKTLNNLKIIRGSSNFKIPLSKSLSEQFSSSTPKICSIVNGAIKTLKSGSCVLSIKFATESGYEIETTKKITVKR
ncbi:MAG: hypothetical protein O3C26_07015 [Actinomycetota bacterium]|nr:hypothetical protein [Actinomycetota bacterium]